MDDSTAYILNLFVNLVFTGVLYCLIPVIVRLALKRPMDKKQATIFAIINAIIIYILFAFIYYLLSLSSGEFVTPKGTAAVLWFFAARAILRSGHKKTFSDTKGFSNHIDVGTIRDTSIENSKNSINNSAVNSFPDKIYCPKCGNTCRGTDLFCKRCGDKLKLE